MNWELHCGDSTWAIADESALELRLKRLHQEKGGRSLNCTSVCDPTGRA